VRVGMCRATPPHTRTCGCARGTGLLRAAAQHAQRRQPWRRACAAAALTLRWRCTPPP
jgi:hypothetical protein